MNKGFSLKRAYKQTVLEGMSLPISVTGLLVLFILVPSVLIFSKKGPGSMHAPIMVSLCAGLLVGALAQRTILCVEGGIRDMILFKDSYLLTGFIAIIAVTAI